MNVFTPNISITGINHKSSDVAQREKYQLIRKDIPNALMYLKGIEAVEGIIILTTCNRLEFFFSLNKSVNPYNLIKKYYNDVKQLNIDDDSGIFYNIEEKEAAGHLFKVISGLESLVLGEYQIQGQVKEAYSIACQAKSVDKILHKLLHAAFRCGKSVRSTTSLGEGKRSVSGVAAKLAINNSNINDKIAIIGVNENTKIFAAELKKNGYNNFTFINRTIYKAEILAEQFGGRSAGLDQIERVLFDSNVVFSSTGAAGFIVTAELLKRLHIQEHCPHLIIDMAVPRDFQPVTLSDSIKIYDISDLKNYLNNENIMRLEDLPQVERIINDEISLFLAWTESQSSDILAPYSEKFESIRQQLLEEYKEQFSPDILNKMDKLTHNFLHHLQSTFVRIIVKQQENGK